MPEENKKDETVNIGKEETKPSVPNEFKICEIWIRSGQVMLDASENFWKEKVRALGVLELCKDIVKTAQPPKAPKIIKPSGFRNFVRGLKGR